MSLLPSPPDIVAASSLVTSVMKQAQGMASESMSRGLAAIQTLANFSVTIPTISVPNFTIPTVTLLPVGATPADPGNLVNTLPAFPADPVTGAVPAIDLGSAPTYDLVAPLLIDIPLPDPFSALVPIAPSLTTVTTPIEPDFTLPDVPTMLGLNLPSKPTLDLPLFTDTVPLAPTAPDARFTWSEVAYHSDQLANLNTRLLSLVNGASTALSPEVEDAMWQRECDAEALLTHNAVENAMQQTAARGFQIPGGQLIRIVQQAINDSQNKDRDSSRKLMVEQAQLEQSNFQLAFTAAMQFESGLIEHFNQVQERALDAAKFTVTALIDLFNARVNLYQADIQAFGTKVDVFKTRLQAALAQLNIYKAELEAQKMVGTMNLQMVQQYTAQISGVKAMVDVFRARVEAVTLAVETNGNRTSLYRTQIEGYASQVKAGTLAVRGYVSQLEGEQAKTQIFSEQVSGYTSRVHAYAALTEAKLSEATLQFRQLQEFPVELYKGRISAYQAEVDAEAQRLMATAAIFNARVEAYAAVSSVEVAQSGMQAEIASTGSKLYASQAQVALQAGVINLKMAQNRSETVQSALRAGGQLATQMASAALSARNVSASLSGTVSNSSSKSAQNSNTKSSTNGKSFSSSTNTNSSSNTGTSNSSSTSNHTSQSMSDEQSSSDIIDQSVTNATTLSITNDTQASMRSTNSAGFRVRNTVGHDTIYTHKG